MQQPSFIRLAAKTTNHTYGFIHTTHFCAQHFDKKTKRYFATNNFSSKYCCDISKYFLTSINRTELSKNKYFQFTQEKWMENGLYLFITILCAKISSVYKAKN